MSSAGKQTQIRRLKRTVNVIRRKMPLDVRYGVERFFPRIRKPLGIVHADEQRAEQSGAVSHGDGVYVIFAGVRLLKRLCDHVVNGKRVVPAGNLRHYSAEPAVYLYL